MMQRIQKIMSASGYCSRRAAEEIILAGRVTVNGNPANLGDSAEETDEVAIDGKPLTSAEKRTYIMLYKPRGYVTTMNDERGRRTVADLVADVGTRVYPVGRLDLNSEGLLIMTDDGEFANHIMHPSHMVEKCYNVLLKGVASESALAILRSALEIDGKPISPAKVRIKSNDAGNSLISITIAEGRNRQVRKMCELAELYVLRLKRVSEGNLTLGDLQSGKWRHLTPNEVENLQK